MNEHEMTDLLERARTGLDPDVAGLVARGAARGRVLRRRRRIGTALAATAVVLGGAALVPVVTAAGPDLVEPAGERTVVVPPEEMGATLAALLPGATVREDPEPYQREVQRGIVGWQGDLVTMTIDERSVGTTSSPEERCLAFMGGPGCVALPDGSWTTELGHVRLDSRTGKTLREERVVRVWTPEGHVLEAGARELSDERLREIALDDRWFRG